MPRSRKPIPSIVKTAIAEHATEYIEGRYRWAAQGHGRREPCISVGDVTDFLRQASMPEDFRFATKQQQRTWTRSVLESLRRKNKLGSSFGARMRCYEPKR